MSTLPPCQNGPDQFYSLFFSILGGPFSKAQNLRNLGSSCEVVFCQNIRIWGFNFNLWAHCRYVKMALTNFINCFSILGSPFSRAQGLKVLGSSCELIFCQYDRILGLNSNLWAHCRHVKMALTNFINCFSILGGPFSGAQGLRVLGSSCEVVFCQYDRILGFNSNLWVHCRHVKMALTNFINCFSILGGPFSKAQNLRNLGSSCEVVFCQYIRIWGFNFNLWAHCRYVKMALANFINYFSILGSPFSGAQALRILDSSCELAFCQYNIWTAQGGGGSFQP